MEHLIVIDKSIPTEKILANWANVSTFIYGTSSSGEIKSLLRHEVLNKNREMIVERLTIRLLSLMKSDLKSEIDKEIHELEERVGEEHGDLSEGDN